jgi:hypothetical protein
MIKYLYENSMCTFSTYRISVFFRVSQILRKKGKFVPFLFCGNYFWRFKTIYRAFLWHTITNIIFTCFIFCELKIVANNAKIRLPRKKTDIRYMKNMYSSNLFNDNIQDILPLWTRWIYPPNFIAGVVVYNNLILNNKLTIVYETLHSLFDLLVDLIKQFVFPIIHLGHTIWLW